MIRSAGAPAGKAAGVAAPVRLVAPSRRPFFLRCALTSLRVLFSAAVLFSAPLRCGQRRDPRTAQHSGTGTAQRNSGGGTGREKRRRQVPLGAVRSRRCVSRPPGPGRPPLLQCAAGGTAGDAALSDHSNTETQKRECTPSWEHTTLRPRIGGGLVPAATAHVARAHASSATRCSQATSTRARNAMADLCTCSSVCLR